MGPAMLELQRRYIVAGQAVQDATENGIRESTANEWAMKEYKDIAKELFRMFGESLEFPKN